MGDPKFLFSSSALAVAITFVSVSSRADITPAQCIAASESGIKLREAHKLRDARAQLASCAAPACPAMIRSECEKELGEVAAATPSVVFEAKDRAGNDLVQVTVSADGKPLGDRLDGTAIPLDPGPHVFRFEASGFPASEKTVVLAEAEKDRHVRIELGAPADARAASKPAPAPAPIAPAVAPVKPASAPPPESGHSAVVPAVALGIGGAARIGGAGFTVLAHGNRARTATPSARAALAPTPARPRVASLNSDATTFGEIAVASYVVGGIGVAAGIAILALRGHDAPSEKSARVVVVPAFGPGFAGVAGVF